jgi:hypothetical protein
MVTFPLRVKPGAARTSVGRVYAGPYGDALVMSVHAPPENRPVDLSERLAALRGAALGG